MPCDYELEGLCNLPKKLKTPGCQYESVLPEEMVGNDGLCKAKESDLTEFCEDCKKDVNECSCLYGE